MLELLGQFFEKTFLIFEEGLAASGIVSRTLSAVHDGCEALSVGAERLEVWLFEDEGCFWESRVESDDFQIMTWLSVKKSDFKQEDLVSLYLVFAPCGIRDSVYVTENFMASISLHR